ncbi:MAG: NAD(P)/FAD-dependent oxidoreductase, partial [Candidatus Omnitrophica bacterium]|nr:NAD(P)/FAD-dependent oxidoreductase [Candidatus Omnitrophota bacterium]
MKPLSKQLTIIGAGPGGFTAAFLAADNGFKVTLIDAEPRLGGTCLHEGCIPSKTLLSIAKTIDQSKAAKKFGVHFDEPQINLEEINAFKRGVILKLSNGLSQLCKQKKIELVQGLASFIDSKTIKIQKPDGSVQELTFKKCIIATGSQPITLPFIPAGSKHVMFSSQALELKEIPKTLLVVGGGYIGLEMATIYAGLGSQVTICEITEGILGGTDKDLTAVLLRSLQKKISDIKLSTAIKDIVSLDDGIEVTFNDAGNITKQRFDKILIATGRKPKLDVLRLKHTKVQVLNNGFINVKKGQQTDDKNIYAIGDVAPGPMLAHKASYEANIAVDHILGKKINTGQPIIPG